MSEKPQAAADDAVEEIWPWRAHSMGVCICAYGHLHVVLFNEEGEEVAVGNFDAEGTKAALANCVQALALLDPLAAVDCPSTVRH